MSTDHLAHKEVTMLKHRVNTLEELVRLLSARVDLLVRRVNRSENQ